MLRGASVLLVVLWHAISIPYESVPAGIGWVMDFLSVYRVPLLLLLSGLLLDQSLKSGAGVRKPAGVYAWGKVRRIAWPLFLWSVVLLLVGWPTADASNPWFWLGDAAHLWYLGVLLACYALGWFTRWVPAVVLFVALFIAMEFVRSDLAFVNNTLWFGLYFFAGAALSRVLDWWLRRSWLLPTAMLAASAAWAGYSATVNGYVPLAHWRPLLFGLMGIVAVVWFASRAPRVRWLEWGGQRSIVFYVAHVPLILLASRPLVEIAPPGLTYAACIGAALAGSWLLARYFSGTVLFELPALPVRMRRKSSDEVSAP